MVIDFFYCAFVILKKLNVVGGIIGFQAYHCWYVMTVMIVFFFGHHNYSLNAQSQYLGTKNLTLHFLCFATNVFHNRNSICAACEA